jgi:hypothetical protein
VPGFAPGAGELKSAMAPSINVNSPLYTSGCASKDGFKLLMSLKACEKGLSPQISVAWLTYKLATI